jgi:hypothetical protein
VFSAAPVRYATGELSLSADDITSSGFGVPWGHTRSFASRQSHNESIGNGLNWHVEQWSFLVETDEKAVIQGRANSPLWFSKTDGNYVGDFDIKQTLIHDAQAEVHRLYDLDGSYTEFDDFTGMFRRHVDPGGNKTEVTKMYGNGYNFSEVERSYTSGGTTTVEQYLYEYDDSMGTDFLTHVTLRRKVGTGGWTNVTRAAYTYYDADEARGELGDLKTVTT